MPLKLRDGKDNTYGESNRRGRRSERFRMKLEAGVVIQSKTKLNNIDSVV